MSTRQTMNAVQVHQFGGPDNLQYGETQAPHLGGDQVLIRSHAVGANPPDWYAREGLPGLPDEMRAMISLPLIPGTDVSGVVEAVSPGVTKFAVGDEVFGMVNFPTTLQGGTYAELVAADVTDLALRPANVDHDTAAALPMSALTAWQFLIELGHDHPSPFQQAQHQPVLLDSTSTVLVNGAAGGVGHLVLQLAKWKGARVIAVASGAHEGFLRRLGADEFINYKEIDAADVVRDVDLVVDNVGGPQSRRFLKTLKRGGSLFPVYFGEFDDDENAALGVTVSSTQVRSNGAQLAEIAKLVSDGKLQVAIDSTFPLSEASKAHQRAAQGHLQGKIVMRVR